MTYRKYQKGNIGEKYYTREGTTIEVIDGGTKKSSCTIKIVGNTPYITEKRLHSIKHGLVHDNYAPWVYGVGYKGVGKYVMLGKMYDCWHRMIGRCYDPYFLNVRPTYRGVTVSNNWHNLQTFCAWYVLNYVDGYEIDKDILSAYGNPIYSEDTCIFIPGRVNNRIRRIRCDNTSGHKGVSYSKSASKWMVRVIDFDSGKERFIGYFKDKEKAFSIQVNESKKETIKAQEYMRTLGYSENVISKIK